MRSHTLILAVLTLTLLLGGCSATTSVAPTTASAGERDYSYLRTPDSFRSFARDSRTYETAYQAPSGWSENAARNSFMYWNAVMAVRTGNPCVAVREVKATRREEIGTSSLPTGSAGGPYNPSGPLTTRPPISFYEFTALTVFTDCAADGAIDAKDYLSRTNRPEQAPRNVAPH